MAALAHELARPLRRGRVPLLVLRLPQFERIAWRFGKRAALRVERCAARAFEVVARAALRHDDLIAHDVESDVFLAAMVDDRGNSSGPNAPNCRSVLRRVSTRLAAGTKLSAECGWTFVHETKCEADLQAAILPALECGAREGQRYEFFGFVGHELRTPLASIRGYLETLLASRLDPATTRRFLQTARREALRMGRLLESMFEFSLLDFSFSEDGKGCDLADAAAAACEILGPLAAARAIDLRNDVRSSTRLAVDPDACLHALVNLIDNAVKYGKTNGLVRLSAARDGTCARIVVDDDGAGVDASEREKIFGLGVRGARREDPGAGIGLALVRMIAQAAAGDVRMTDSPLGGARFELRLPLKAEFTEAMS